MFFEFLLEFLHWICFVRINLLIFSFGFDFAVRFVSWCLFFALTVRVVPLLTSTYVGVLVSVFYLDFSSCPTFDHHVCFRVFVSVLPWISSY